MRMTPRPFWGEQGSPQRMSEPGSWRLPYCRWGNRPRGGRGRPKASVGAGRRPLVWALQSCGTISSYCTLVHVLQAAGPASVAETVACGLGWGTVSEVVLTL